MACKDVEVSKNGDQVDWDNLIAQYDATKEAGFNESESESDQEQDKGKDQDCKNLLENEDDQGLGNQGAEHRLQLQPSVGILCNGVNSLSPSHGP